MKFELDDTLIDDIIFHMEDQYGDFRLDTQERMVINTENYDDIYDEDIDFDDDERFIWLPDWSSADGFRLMEKFTNTLKNPVLRQELTVALNRNKGVFRAFKDTLSCHPQAEKQWYDFKERKMKSEVISWYNALREEWGLEPIGEEPEDNTYLVMEDFKISEDGNFCFKAETQEGETAGIICAEKAGDNLHISKFEVEPEYRGMGLGKTLLAKFLEKTGDNSITIDVPADADFFTRSLLLEGFEPVSQKFIRKNMPADKIRRKV